MRIALGVVILLLCIVSSCRDRVICPAYQSTYILDDSVRMAYHSYLWKVDEKDRQDFLAQERAKDSIPGQTSRTPSAEYFAYVEEYVVPTRQVNKTKYGMIKYQPWWLKNHYLRTAPMQDIHPPVFNEEEYEGEGNFTKGDFALVDSLGGDSTRVNVPLALKKDSLANQGPRFLYGYKIDDQHNMEQVYYNKYFAQYLVDTTSRKQKPVAALDSAAQDTTGKKKKGFFKNLFKKKNKNVSDSTQLNQDLTAPDPTEEKEDPNGGQ